MLTKGGRTVLGVMLMVSAFPAYSAAQLAPTMTGETFFGFSNTDIQPRSSGCSVQGGTTFTFDMAGPATGPYPGTFVEHGTITTGPAAFTVPVNGTYIGNTVVGFHSEFTIYSGTTTVHGTKDLLAPTATVFYCANFIELDQNSHPSDAYARGFGYSSVNVSYKATVQSPTGTFQDDGTARAEIDTSSIHYSGALDISTQRSREYFFSTENQTIPLGPAILQLSPKAATNEVSTSHTVTAEVLNAIGAPVSNTTVRFSVTGSVTTSGSCQTDTAGTCSFTYQGPALPGADVITAYADANHNGSPDAGEPVDTATKVWTLPVSTPGQVTGGGHIANPTLNGEVAFGFVAQNSGGKFSGNCTVVDQTANVKIKCVDVTTLVQTGDQRTGGHAVFFGHAEVNGVLATYRIDVDDLDESGIGRDTFKIQTDNGYVAAGPLTSGNIQIHNP